MALLKCMEQLVPQEGAQALLAGLTRIRRVIDLSAASHLEVKEALAFIDKLSAQAQDMLAKPGEKNGNS